jgi:hypothetical protein
LTGSGARNGRFDVEPDHDVDPRLVALAIQSKLPGRRRSPPGLGEDRTQLLERRAGGRVAVSTYDLLRLGDDDCEGPALYAPVMSRIRAERLACTHRAKRLWLMVKPSIF